MRVLSGQQSGSSFTKNHRTKNPNKTHLESWKCLVTNAKKKKKKLLVGKLAENNDRVSVKIRNIIPMYEINELANWKITFVEVTEHFGNLLFVFHEFFYTSKYVSTYHYRLGLHGPRDLHFYELIPNKWPYELWFCILEVFLFSHQTKKNHENTTYNKFISKRRFLRTRFP